MRTYGRIETNFWQNPKVRALSCDESRHLLLYLYTCPHGNSLGCFVLPDGYIMADLSWPPETLALRFSELNAKGFIERDQDSYLVRIAGWFGHNKIENRNVALGAMKIIAALPRGGIFDNLLADLVAIDNKFLMPLLSASGSRRETVPKRSESPEPEPEPEPKPEPDEEAALSATAPAPPVPPAPPATTTTLVSAEVTNPRRQTTDRRGARLARDWTPAPDGIAFAAAVGLPPAAIAAEAAKFRDYWIAIPGARGCKLDIRELVFERLTCCSARPNRKPRMPWPRNMPGCSRDSRARRYGAPSTASPRPISIAAGRASPNWLRPAATPTHNTPLCRQRASTIGANWSPKPCARNWGSRHSKPAMGIRCGSLSRITDGRRMRHNLNEWPPPASAHSAWRRRNSSPAPAPRRG